MEIWVAVRGERPNDSMLVNIWEGCGDLWAEDETEGYVDYVNYRTFTLDGEEGPREQDGGEFLLKEPAEKMAREDIIAQVLEFHFGEKVDAQDYIKL